MIDFAFFGLKPFSWTSKTICKELENLGLKTCLFDWRDVQLKNNSFYYEDNEMDLPKVAMIENKVRVGYQGDKVFLFDWLNILQQKGVNFFNTPKAIQLASNKIAAAITLSEKSCLTPETRLVKSGREIESCLKEWKDIILKPISGQSSIRVNRFIYDENRYGDELSSVFNNLQRAEAVQMLMDYGILCAQKYILNKGRDIRTHVVDGKVVSLYARNSLPNTWRIMDLNSGMNVSKTKLTPEIERASIQAVQALGLDYGTIDLVENNDSAYVIEVNPSVTIWDDHEKNGFTIDPDGSIKYYVNHILKILNKSEVAL